MITAYQASGPSTMVREELGRAPSKSLGQSTRGAANRSAYHRVPLSRGRPGMQPTNLIGQIYSTQV